MSLQSSAVGNDVTLESSVLESMLDSLVPGFDLCRLIMSSKLLITIPSVPLARRRKGARVGEPPTFRTGEHVHFREVAEHVQSDAQVFHECVCVALFTETFVDIVTAPYPPKDIGSLFGPKTVSGLVSNRVSFEPCRICFRNAKI